MALWALCASGCPYARSWSTVTTFNVGTGGGLHCKNDLRPTNDRLDGFPPTHPRHTGTVQLHCS